MCVVGLSLALRQKKKGGEWVVGTKGATVLGRLESQGSSKASRLHRPTGWASVRILLKKSKSDSGETSQ